MSKRRTFIILILIFLVAVSGLIIYWMEQHPKLLLINNLNAPDSYANGIAFSRYDAQGNISSQLFSPSLTHYNKDNTTIFKTPHIILYSQNQQPWDVTADEGIATQDLNSMKLINNVKLHQPGGKQNNDVTITTSKLIINTKEQTADTDQPVTLYQKGNDNTVTIVNAVGIHVNQKTGEIQLLSKARGYYAPSAK